MFEAFPSLKNHFSELSLHKITNILAEPKANPSALHIDAVVQAAIEPDLRAQRKAPTELGDITRTEFFEYFRRAAKKYYKKLFKKMEGIVLNRNRKIDDDSQPRVIPWAIDTYRQVERSGSELHSFVYMVELKQGWGCACQREDCREQRSQEEFVCDLMRFMFLESPNLFEKVSVSMECARSRKGVAEDELAILEKQVGLIRRIEAEEGNNPTEQLAFEIEKKCVGMLTKKERRRLKAREKKLKETESTRQEPNQPRSQPQEEDEEVTALLVYLEGWRVDERRREQCRVDEAWVARLRKYTSK